MSFVGRERELEMLERFYRSGKTSFVPVYGRRRVGKSELIKQFIKGKPSVYFLGKQAPAALQLSEFMEEAADLTGNALLAEIVPKSWKHAFSLLLEHYTGSDPLVLVLDEFQWIADVSGELPSVLQGLLDNEWKRSKNVMLILCGSYLGFMEREVLGHKSPLFGRRSGQIFLKPFGIRETVQFHPARSLEDQAKIYFICGGVPLYQDLFSNSAPIGHTIQQQILDPLGMLYREAEFLLKEELREVGNYYALLSTLARGPSTPADVSRESGIPSNRLVHYWKHLQELGYVSRQTPLSSKNMKTVKYALEDPMLRFWFRFVFPKQSFIEKSGPKESYHALVSPHLDRYYGYEFEQLCRDLLGDYYVNQGMMTPFEIGSYWDKSVQIDVVGIREKEGIDLGECKWGKVSSTPKLVKEIGSKVSHYPNPKNLTVTQHLFTKKPLKGTLPAGLVAHDLESLVNQ